MIRNTEFSAKERQQFDMYGDVFSTSSFQDEYYEKFLDYKKTQTYITDKWHFNGADEFGEFSEDEEDVTFASIRDHNEIEDNDPWHTLNTEQKTIEVVGGSLCIPDIIESEPKIKCILTCQDTETEKELNNEFGSIVQRGVENMLYGSEILKLTKDNLATIKVEDVYASMDKERHDQDVCVIAYGHVYVCKDSRWYLVEKLTMGVPGYNVFVGSFKWMRILENDGSTGRKYVFVISDTIVLYSQRVSTFQLIGRLTQVDRMLKGVKDMKGKFCFRIKKIYRGKMMLSLIRECMVRRQNVRLVVDGDDNVYRWRNPGSQRLCVRVFGNAVFHFGVADRVGDNIYVPHTFPFVTTTKNKRFKAYNGKVMEIFWDGQDWVPIREVNKPTRVDCARAVMVRYADSILWKEWYRWVIGDNY